MTDSRTDARPNRLILLSPDQWDPRTAIEPHGLEQASRNGFPIVATRQAKTDKAGLIAGGGIALLLGGLTFWSMSGHRAPQTVRPIASPQSPSTPLMPPAPVLSPAPTHSLLLPSVPPIGAPAVGERAPVPVVVYDSGQTAVAGSAGAGPAASVPPVPTKSPLALSGGTDNDQFATRVGDGAAEVATAQVLSNPATTVTQGTLIPAVLETAIDTDLPGYVRAVVSRDVRSFDSSRVLVPRSSRLIGQYKSGLAAGQTRAYIIWSRLIRPDGVSVALGSPAVDFAGRSGLDGKVDSHFFKRFGSAALLSVIGGLSAIGSASVVFSGGQSAASVAAQSGTQIPPTIRVAQGQPIRVFTAKDLDFSTVSSGDLQP